MKLKEFQKYFKILTKEQVIGLLWQKHNDCKFAENEINRLEQQNAKLKNQIADLEAGKKMPNKIDLAIDELGKMNELLTNTIIEVTQEEFDLNKLCYLEEISAKFCEKINQQIKELEETKK